MHTTELMGIVGPDRETEFKNLGDELAAMLDSIDRTLAGFTYQGADPNAVVARVTALEAWRTVAQAKIAALETKIAAEGKTPWVALGTLITPTALFSGELNNLFIRRHGDRIDIRGYIDHYAAIGALSALSQTPLPPMYRANQVALVSTSGNGGAAGPPVRVLEFGTDGHIRAYSSINSGAWWSFSGQRYFTDAPLP